MKKIVSLLNALLLFFVFSHASFSQTSENAKKIDELINKYVEYGLFNGSVLVAQNGNIILSKGYGYSDFENKVQCAPQTKFRIGSITKQFTSMLIMQLVEKGKIKLDAKLSDYLPYYRKDNGEKITIHHLLTHTSGIPNYTNIPNFMDNEIGKPYTPKELILKFGSLDLEFEPGTSWNYSNTGYFILGAIIEEVTGKRYEDALRENIFNPLEMDNSGYEHNDIKMTNQATGYDIGPEGVTVSKFIDMTIPFAAGSMYSTVEDLYKWDRALYTDKLISKELKEKMFTPFLKNYAYGWGVMKINANGIEKKGYSHSGGINGFNANIVRIVDDNIVIIALSNYYNGESGKVSNDIGKILYGIPYNFPKKSVTSMLMSLGAAKGYTAAVAEIKEVLKNEKDTYTIKEGEINNLGYTLMQEKKLDDAVEVLKLNVEMFPASSNVYDSLGEAYMTKGDKENALINYKKSVELNPDSQSGKDAIKKLEGK
ncbi:MAG: serine hydrolase [Bacteroidetes bacterium]|nr:serine hydrolase [Bacteroidota bacterium]